MIRPALSLVAVGCLFAASASIAQTNENGPQRERRPIPAPTNLKVLPKDTTGQQVIAIMRGFEGDLGVQCSYCHAKDPATGRPNFASDANPMKDRARVMMKMANAINTEYLAQLTDPKPEHDVTCGTCHRGMPKPEVFLPKPHESEHRDGATAAPGTPPASH